MVAAHDGVRKLNEQSGNHMLRDMHGRLPVKSWAAKGFAASTTRGGNSAWNSSLRLLKVSFSPSRGTSTNCSGSGLPVSCLPGEAATAADAAGGSEAPLSTGPLPKPVCARKGGSEDAMSGLASSGSELVTDVGGCRQKVKIERRPARPAEPGALTDDKPGVGLCLAALTAWAVLRRCRRLPQHRHKNKPASTDDSHHQQIPIKASRHSFQMQPPPYDQGRSDSSPRTIYHRVI